MKNKNNKIALVLLISLVLIGGLVFTIYSGGLQSITGVSTYVDSNGKNHWLVSGVADNIDEGYTFSSLPPSTKIGDTTITPKETAKLTITRKESYCSYQVRQVTISKLLGLVKINYFELLSPERVALINVADDSGNVKTIDGTITRTEAFYDNGGKLEFTSLGTLSAKKDCLSGDNVAIFYIDGKMYVKDEQALISFANSLIIPFTSKDATLIKDNNNFISNFEDYSLKNERFIGNVRLGSVSYKIDADQDYYDSVIYSPPKEVKPRIDSISMSSEVRVGTTSSVSVKISNQVVSKGSIVIDASVDYGSISPESVNADLENSITKKFTITSPNSESNNKVCFEVCSVQSPINCDNKCYNFEVTKDSVKEFCGDNICQSYESFTSCPSDCIKLAECTTDADCSNGYECVEKSCKLIDKSCSWYQESYTKTEKDYGFLFWRAYTPFVNPITTETTECRNAGWLNWIFISLIVITLGTIAIKSAIGKKK